MKSGGQREGIAVRDEEEPLTAKVPEKKRKERGANLLICRARNRGEFILAAEAGLGCPTKDDARCWWSRGLRSVPGRTPDPPDLDRRLRGWRDRRGQFSRCRGCRRERLRRTGCHSRRMPVLAASPDPYKKCSPFRWDRFCRRGRWGR